jgi:hypothetical protein
VLGRFATGTTTNPPRISSRSYLQDLARNEAKEVDRWYNQLESINGESQR